MLPLPKQDLPVHLRANPFFVFSFEFPFILSPSFISSVTCLPALLTTSYQTERQVRMKRRGERKEREKVRENEDLEREMNVDEVPELCHVAHLSEK